MVRSFEITSWNHLNSDSPVGMESSWRADFVELPPVVSAKFGNRRIKTQSFFFNEDGATSGTGDRAKFSGGLFDPYSESHSAVATTSSSNNQSPTGSNERTRIKPPGDVIRLEDRLFYLLQPPLENLLGGKTLEFPFEPFNFQYAGIAFLFPRHSAILADEMGLGKTMQAITSVRMLLRSGCIQNVLLICPKPLVTNWQREFKTWAPEITVAAVKGNQDQRAWHWKSNQACLLYTSPSPRDRTRSRMPSSA